MSKKYVIDEDTLRELLRAAHTLAILERDGVDNWWGWMDSADDHLIDCASELPWNEGKFYDDLREMVVGEDYTIDDLVDDQIAAFWEEHKEPVTAHWIGIDGDQCSHCGRSLRDLMDSDSYYSSEFENKGFDSLVACPFCGTKMIKDA